MDTKSSGATQPTQTLQSQILLNVQQVAELLNCSVRHVYRMSDAGRMPQPVRVGGLVRWNRAALYIWVADGCQPVRR